MNSKLFRDIGWLVGVWWLSDRIRISVQDGRLLRIKPGDIIQIGDVQAEVESRSVIHDGANTCLLLTCRTPTGIAELQIGIAIDGRVSTVTWNQAGVRRDLRPEELEFWPRQTVIQRTDEVQSTNLLAVHDPR